MRDLPWHEILSGLLALYYLLTSFLYDGLGQMGYTFFCLLPPLSAIWFPNALGGMTGGFGGDRPAITSPSPGCLVRFMGWVLLLGPFTLPLVARLLTS